MSTLRAARGGYCNPSKLPMGPNGRALCRRCGVEVPQGRRTFCSAACIDEWKVRTDPGHARAKVWERDKGVCANCGVDSCAELKAKLGERLRARTPMGRYWQADHIVPVVEGGGECGLEGLRTLCTACHRAETAALAARRAAARRTKPMREATG